MSTRSYYSYRTAFEFFRENKEFECQNNARNQPPLELTPVGVKTPYPKTLTLPTDLSKRKEKSRKEYVPEDPESDASFSDSPSIKYDFPIIANIVNQKSNNSIKRKNTRSAKNRTRQSRCLETLIRPTKVDIKTKYVIKRRTTGKINGTLSNYAQS